LVSGELSGTYSHEKQKDLPVVSAKMCRDLELAPSAFTMHEWLWILGGYFFQ
jgi:hypothetical protein